MTFASRVVLALQWSGVAILLVTLGLLCGPAFLRLTEYWRANDMYSYGFLVPLISVYLVWLRRDHLSAIPVLPSFRIGLAALTAGLLILTVGRVSSTNLLEWLALPVIVCALCLLLLGRRVTQAMAFPLAYLFATIPFWDVLTSRLHAPFQLYSAKMGVAALRLFDIPVIREGVLIHLPNITLEVADVCSGVNQLVAILCIGVPVAHLHVKRWSKRAVIVLAAVLIALLSNGLRVALISLFAFYGVRGADGDVHGPYSILRTMVISGIGYLVLFWLIARFADHAPAKASDIPRRSPAMTAPGPGLRLSALAVAIATLTAGLSFQYWREVEPVRVTGALAAFPTVIGRWQFSGNVPLSASVRAIGFDYTLARRYRTKEGLEAELLIGYFERQRQAHELAGFHLSRFLSSDSGRPLVRNFDGCGKVKDFFNTSDGSSYHVTYWYVLNGRISSNGYEAKWWTTWDSLVRRRSNGAVVVIRSKVKSGESLDASRVKTSDLIEQLLLNSRVSLSES